MLRAYSKCQRLLMLKGALHVSHLCTVGNFPPHF
uniref:Uncharacterized protein n=1 Tax=Anguilla anguilla TaxID=7936 RepID=A0A0E9V0V9_ANGAN